jgi:hypothetical protein
LAKPGEELYRVMIRQKILSTPGMSVKTYTYAVSYIAPGQPPTTLFIPEDQWTEKKERELILKDIEERKKFRPEVVRK